MVNIIINTVSELTDMKVSKISLTSSFESIGLDDLRVVELIMKLEDKFGFSADLEMYETETVGELIELVINEN